MTKSIIFVEGCSDAVFLNDLIFTLLPENSSRFKDLNKFNRGRSIKISETPHIEIFVAGGCTSILKYKIKIKEYNDEGYNILLIQDADNPVKDTFIGGVKKRTEYLDKIKDDHKIEFKTFLFPNNNNDGDLEDILMQLVLENKYISFYENYFNYSNNVKTFSNEIYSNELMQKKYLIYNYSQVYHGMIMSNEKNRDYLNDHWDLEHQCLDPIKAFLSKQLNL